MTQKENNQRNTGVSEIAGVFAEHEDVHNAMKELQVGGIARRNISVLAGKEVVEATYGDELPAVQALLEDPDVPTDALVADEDIGIAQGATIAGGTLVGASTTALIATFAAPLAVASSLALLGAVAGAALGLLASKKITDRHHEHHKMQERSGGFIVWVSIPSKAKEIAATYIMRRNGAVAIQASA